jgi:hypothetical protein
MVTFMPLSFGVGVFGWFIFLWMLAWLNEQ